MFKKTKLPEVDPVVLKPWHGIRPAYYILTLFALFVIAIFFLLCLLPGLVSDKAYVVFDTPLPVMGVYEDGRYLGNGYKTKIETTCGNHSYTFTYEGIKIGEAEVKIRRHYFFTLFVHRYDTVRPELTFTDEVRAKAIDVCARDIALFSPITDYSGSAVYPSVMRTFAETAAVTGISDARDIWLYSLLHVTSQTMYDDYRDAKAVLADCSIEFENDESRKIEAFLDSLYGEGKIEKYTASGENGKIKAEKNGSFYTYKAGTVNIGKSTSSSYPESDYIPISVSYNEFSILGSLITENEYAQFVEANAKWSRDNLDSLMSEGLVDSNYLKNINLNSRSSRPVRYISWNAAEAYCQWKSECDGVKYSLPTLTEWTVAALSASDKNYVTSLVFVENNSPSPTGLMGQLWDMTESAYIPLMRLVSEETTAKLVTLFPYDDIIVTGGSYVTESVSLSDTGTAHKSSCSEFNGFRLVKHE